MIFEGLLALLGLAVVKRQGTQTTPGSGAPPPKLDPEVLSDVNRWRRTVEIESHGRVGLTAGLILALIARESRGISTAAGPTGDYGLMQITLPAYQDYIAEVNDPAAVPFPDCLLDPVINVRIGSWFLARKIEEMGNEFNGLRAYNAGTTGARRDPLIAASYAQWITDHKRTFA